MAVTGVGYSSAAISQVGRWLLPLLPTPIAVGCVVIAVLIATGYFAFAFSQGRDRFISYGALFAIAIGLIVGGGF